MYRDVALTALEPIAGKSIRVGNAVYLFPNGEARAKVEIPPELVGWELTAHACSGFARVGFQVECDPERPMSGDQKYLHTIVSNWSNHYGLKVHSGERIALCASDRIKKLPLAQEMLLTTSGNYLAVEANQLPQIDGMPFWDPHDEQRSRYVKEGHGMIDFQPDDFRAVRTRERPAIPPNHIGLIASVIPGVQHSTSNLMYQTSNGPLILEIKSFRGDSIQVPPGTHIATLRIYESNYPLPKYNGRLGKSDSVMSFLQT